MVDPASLNDNSKHATLGARRIHYQIETVSIGVTAWFCKMLNQLGVKRFVGVLTFRHSSIPHYIADRAGLQWREEDKYPTISHIYWGLLGLPWMVLDR